MGYVDHTFASELFANRVLDRALREQAQNV